jgi:superfamily I DNA/RNA helicase
VRAAIAAALVRGLGPGLSADFLAEEWDEVVDAWGVHDAEAYAAVPRLGRKTRLGPRQRAAAWEVFVAVRERLEARGLTTWAAIYVRLTRWLEKGGSLPFTHVVVDEAQDLSVAQGRFLAAAGRERADALFFAGDLGQRISHPPFSWAKLGIDIRGRSVVLKVCYRTSHQIRSTADRLLAKEIRDQDDNVETRKGTVSVFDGPEPVLRLFENEEAEIGAVVDWLEERVSEGTAEGEIALLVRGQDQLHRARRAVERARLSPAVMTMHEAKGMEFRAVAVMALDENVLPDPRRLEGVGDLADLEMVQDTERHLLYVAATRARDRLLLSGVAPGSEFLDDLK